MQFSTLATIVIAAVAALGGIIVALIARGGEKRTSSGNVQTSDARTLFDTAGQLIDRLSADSVQLRARIEVYEKKTEDYEKRIDLLEGRVDELERSNRDLKERNQALEKP